MDTVWDGDFKRSRVPIHTSKKHFPLREVFFIYENFNLWQLGVC